MFEIPHLALIIGGVTTLAISFLLVSTTHWHGVFTLDSHEGVQKFHTSPTPRVGGIAIAVGLVAAWGGASGGVVQLLGPMLFAGIPAFIFGLAEDLTKRVGVRERLCATIASGVAACYLTGMHLTRVDVWGFDYLMGYWPIAIAFTAFAIGGVANSINIIDGFNGLAAGAILICLTAIGFIAYEAGDPTLAKLCFVLGGVTAGFLVVNFPFGKIFLGDGGAYLLGFMLAWTTVLLLVRNPGVSVWAPLLACGYPVLEVIFSILRRRAPRPEPRRPRSPAPAQLGQSPHHQQTPAPLCPRLPKRDGLPRHLAFLRWYRHCFRLCFTQVHPCWSYALCLLLGFMRFCMRG